MAIEVRPRESELQGWTDPQLPLVAAAPSARCTVCVIVPARDEAGAIAATLHGLNQQIEFDGRPFDRDRYEVIVLANNCRDATAEIARAFARAHPGLRLHVATRTLPAAEANIGTARRVLMDEACARLLAHGHRRGAIASTDADTVVTPTWLAAIEMELARGVDAVGGRIIARGDDKPDATFAAATRRYHLRDVAYGHHIAELESLLDPDSADPWPRHHQHFGASLAVTAETYHRAGGLPPVPALEDMAFHDSLRRIDALIRHSPAVRVVTSARRSGRVAIGLSTQLGEWEALARAGRLPLVESPAASERRVRTRRALRELWHGARFAGVLDPDALQAVAMRLHLERRWLALAVLRPQPFGMFYESVLARAGTEAPTVQGAVPYVEITTAIPRLRERLAELRPCCRLPVLDDLG